MLIMKISSEASSFNPLPNNYGNSGKNTILEMAKALESRSLSLTYNLETRKFTVLGSSKFDMQSIKEIFRDIRGGDWQPQVLDETDMHGNRLVRLRGSFSEAVRDYRERTDEWFW